MFVPVSSNVRVCSSTVVYYEFLPPPRQSHKKVSFTSFSIFSYFVPGGGERDSEFQAKILSVEGGGREGGGGIH